MSSARSYGQACYLSRSLDVLGERWTLLVIRELLAGPRRYGELATHLDGMGTNLLATRLKEMELAGLIEKKPERSGAKRQVYILTERGLGLRPMLRELLRWGLRELASPDATNFIHRDLWDQIAVVLLHTPSSDRTGSGLIALCSGEKSACFRLTKGVLSLEREPSSSIDTELTGNPAGFIKLISGSRSLATLTRCKELTLKGDRTLAREWAAGYRAR
ncbi:MAG: hypothetical protein SynsKO_09200 [Synoicihabitans sp.]